MARGGEPVAGVEGTNAEDAERLGAVLAFDFGAAVGAASLAALRAFKRSAGVAGTAARRRTGATPELELLDIPQSNEKQKRKEGKENKRTTEQSASRLSQWKTDSHGPVITVTAKWSVHGLLRTEREERCGGNSHPRDTSNEQR